MTRAFPFYLRSYDMNIYRFLRLHTTLFRAITCSPELCLIVGTIILSRLSTLQSNRQAKMANPIPGINSSTERDSSEQENLKGNLCCVCQTFRIQHLRSGESFACRKTMAEVTESAQLGCVLCFMLCEQLKLNIPSEECRERYRADNIFLKGVRKRVSDEEKAAGYYEGDIENLEVEVVPLGRGPRSIPGQLALLTTEGLKICCQFSARNDHSANFPSQETLQQFHYGEGHRSQTSLQMQPSTQYEIGCSSVRNHIPPVELSKM